MEPNWLNPQEQRAWRGFHLLRTQLMAHLARQLSQDCGLSEAEFLVLVVVSESPGARIRARELGRALGWERSRLSHQIARMERRGTIERSTCDQDARGFDVILTKAGLAAIQAAAPMHLEVVRHCFIDLLSPAQLASLAEISEIVVGHIQTQHSEFDPCD